MHGENISNLLDTNGNAMENIRRGQKITRELRDEYIIAPLATALFTNKWGLPPPPFHSNTSIKLQLSNVASLTEDQIDTLETVVNEACGHWTNMRRRKLRRQTVTP